MAGCNTYFRRTHSKQLATERDLEERARVALGRWSEGVRRREAPNCMPLSEQQEMVGGLVGAFQTSTYTNRKMCQTSYKTYSI